MAKKKKPTKKQRREDLKKQLAQRTKETAETSYGSGRGIFKEGLTDVNFWKSTPGRHSIDIIPYLIGDWDPRIKKFNPRNTLQPQMWHYVLEVFIHRDVGGVEGQMYICMERTYGKPCPICNHRKQLQKEGADDDVIKALYPARYPRSIYNILCYDSAEEEGKGVQVWNTSHWLMQQYLIKLAKGPMRPGQRGVQPYIDFSNPYKDSGGRLISWEHEGSGMSTKYLAHQLIPRDYDIDEDYLDRSHCLDNLIYIPKFGEVYEAYFGESYDEDSEEEEDESLEVSDEDEDEAEEPEEEDEAEEEEDEPSDDFDDMSRKELKAYIKEESLDVKVLKKMSDDDIRDAIREAEAEEEPEESEEEEPEEEETDPLDEMDRKELKKYIKSEGLDVKVLKKMSDDDIREKIREAENGDTGEDGDLTCPGDGTLGVDIETLEECDDCNIWEECSEEAERIEKAKKKKKRKK